MGWLLSIGTGLAGIVEKVFGVLVVRAGFTAAYWIGVAALFTAFFAIYQATSNTFAGLSSMSLTVGGHDILPYVWYSMPANFVPCVSAYVSVILARVAFDFAMSRLDVIAQIPGG